MGAFAEHIDPRLYNNKLRFVKEALEQKNDGSLEEFLEALSNHSIPAASIARALTKTTDIPVSDCSVQRWRRGLNG